MSYIHLTLSAWRMLLHVIALLGAVAPCGACTPAKAPGAAWHEKPGSYDKVVSVLERFPYSYDAPDALAALRPIAGWKVSLERVIAKGPAKLRGSAIAVAGLTGDARFLPELRRQLEAIRVTVLEQDEQAWFLLVDVVDALGGIESPEAASTLLAFWQTNGSKVSPAWRRPFLRDAAASAIWRYGARNEWVPCEETVYSSTRIDPERAVLGTKSPAVEYVVDARRRWAAICEARKDDDGNGKLEVRTLQHGDTGGDELRPYLVLGSGSGTEIDDFVAADPTGRWIAVTKNFCVQLVDAQSGKAIVLKGADGRPGDTIGGAHRAASFSSDGKHMLYVRSDGNRATLIQRDLPSGVERPMDPGPGTLSRAFFERSGRFVVMDMVVRDTDGDGLLEAPHLAASLSKRRCRGPVASASFFGHVGDAPIQRIAPVQGGNVANAPQGTTFEAATLPEPEYELTSQMPAAALPRSPLPLGPFRWHPRAR